MPVFYQCKYELRIKRFGWVRRTYDNKDDKFSGGWLHS